MTTQLRGITDASSESSESLREFDQTSAGLFSGLDQGMPVLVNLARSTTNLGSSAGGAEQAIKQLSGSTTGLLSAIGGPIGFAIGSIIGLFVSSGVATREAARDFDKLRTSLQGTRDDYQSLALQVEATAKATSLNSSMSRDDARAVAGNIARARTTSPEIWISP